MSPPTVIYTIMGCSGFWLFKFLDALDMILKLKKNKMLAIYHV